ncbi:hypothetical protein EKO04_003876 [Ascochyta lentis]|uniref:Uncharacterized protein n=1 Tax=Ascochyta lentis TaxID=205686 RepID=A0A8H7MKQ4_9PLEO|nr:hypothetical protein EKO04_003876 [Ascochyta lentis]
MAPALLYDDEDVAYTSPTASWSPMKPLATPSVAKLDFGAYQSDDELIADITESLKVSGGCIVRGMYEKSTVGALEKELRPHIEATNKADSSRDDLWHRVCENFLTSKLTKSWHGNEARSSVSLPQLSTTVTFSVGPGTKAQGLHRDDDIYHTQHSATATHYQGQDAMLCLFVAGKQCTKYNGATRIVPGSHLWDFTVPPPSYTEYLRQEENQYLANDLNK